MFLLGMTAPGRTIVATALADEFLDQEKRTWVFPLSSTYSGVIVITTALYFQRLSRDIKYIQLMNLAVLTLLLCLTIIIVPESPKWLLSKGRYDEARASLMHVARFNGQKVEKEDLVFEAEL